MEDRLPSLNINELVGSIISLDKLFEEKPHHHNLGEGDVTSPSSDAPTPSSVSSPTEPTKSTNLEETESSNHTQFSTETTDLHSKDSTEVSDTRQSALVNEDLDVEIKSSIGKMVDHDRNV